MRGPQRLLSLFQTQSVANLSPARGVIEVAGQDGVKLLQGLVTNDVTMLSESRGPLPLYAAMLNSQGRVLHDLFIHRRAAAQGEAGPSLLLDVDSKAAPDILALLTKYKLRSKVQLRDVSDKYAVCASLGLGAAGDQESATWPPDPRMSDLGRRAIFPAASAPAAAPAGSSRYRLWRFLHGVAEGRDEIPSAASMPLEYNLEPLNGVSYSKGCYVGQELTARTHYTGIIRKRVVPVEIEGAVLLGGQPATPASPASQGSGARSDELDVGSSGMKSSVGRLLAWDADQGCGLALLRVSSVLASEAGDESLSLKATPGVILKPWRPKWWSEAWGREEAGGPAARTATPAGLTEAAAAAAKQ